MDCVSYFHLEFDNFYKEKAKISRIIQIIPFFSNYNITIFFINTNRNLNESWLFSIVKFLKKVVAGYILVITYFSLSSSLFKLLLNSLSIIIMPPILYTKCVVFIKSIYKSLNVLLPFSAYIYEQYRKVSIIGDYRSFTSAFLETLI